MQDTRGHAHATFFQPLLQAPAGKPVRGWVGDIELHVAGKDSPENPRRCRSESYRPQHHGARRGPEECAWLSAVRGARPTSFRCFLGLMATPAYLVARLPNFILASI